MQQDPSYGHNPLVPYQPRTGFTGRGAYAELINSLADILKINGVPANHVTWILANQQIPIAGTASNPANLVIGFGYD